MSSRGECISYACIDALCSAGAEFDGPQNQLTALLVLNETAFNSTSPTSNLTYYACPPSQRNFTSYEHRFFMNGEWAF